MGLVQATPAAADTAPEEDTGYIRNSIGEQRRLDRCLTGVALHFGGAEMKAKAVEGLTGTPEELRAIVGDVGWIGSYPLGQARDADGAAALDYRDASKARTEALTAANKPFAESAYASDDMEWDAPEAGADVLRFTLFTQEELAGRLGWDGHSNAGAEAVARAREIADQNRGTDSWHDAAADSMLAESELGNTDYSGGTTASDIASYLRHGGFLTEAPADGTAEYRVEVEALKQAWAACDSQNPVDSRRVLNGLVMKAMAEWEMEYASQSTPRGTIIQAEADAAGATREATDDMIEALGQAWLADQILTWQKYWQDTLAVDPEALGQPDQALYDQAETALAAARDKIATLVTSADQHAETAGTAAQNAVTAQQEAWAIADTNHVPRGRGLMYAQQSVQVARASSAAAEAAAKATRTALDAANATVADSDTLLAKAQTESHAVNTEFRRVAAQEAAAQAKAAADTADAQAKAATDSATAAKSAQSTAEDEAEQARKAAATAQAQRAKSELEHATAVAARVTAATERAKAKKAETEATSQKTVAETAKTDAATAATDAKTKRASADEKAKEAQTAREKAFAALRDKQATAARVAALEAAAAAAEGTEAAGETREAADKAHTAAEEAATAATTAQTAADEATDAAVTARSAATKAEGTAKRAQANADNAWSAYLDATGAAATAHAAAAEALDASQDAAFRADSAATASENATELSKKAGEESAAAASEADAAVKTVGTAVGRAYAAGQSALAARDSATQATVAANNAIAVGTPYKETDSSAAFAVLVGQSSKSLAEQQAAAAEAKATEATEAAQHAQQAAEQALGDAKLAAEAAAQAASDSVRAVKAVAKAQTSATEATAAQQAAEKAADTASGHAQQAGDDAASARLTAKETDTEAVAADREATEAERDAARAAQAADRASSAAADADADATQAEQDAKEAEAKAADADADSNAAEDAAEQAEQEQRERNEAEHKDALEDGSTPVAGGAGNWPALGEREEQILLDACGQTCVDEYRDALAAVAVNVVEWTGDHGGQILLDQLGVAKVKQCLAEDDVESCLWTVVDVPASAVVVGRIPALAAAIEKVSTGIRQVFEDADNAQRRLTELTQLISSVRSTPRLEQCVAGVALHAGGSNMKAKSIEGLTGTADELHTIVGDIGWIGLEPLGRAKAQDIADAIAYRDAFAARKTSLEDANRPYALSSFSDDITLHAPEFGAEVLQFSLFTQEELANRLGWDGHTNASPEAIARAKEVTEENRGKDAWHDYAADIMLRESNLNNTHFSGGTTASDIASYLRHGGFVTEAPTPGSVEFRLEVENLKQAWSACDHGDPVDPRNKLSAVVSQASAEWSAEYAAQAAPRAAILQAEADAAAATRQATDDMIEAIGQAWLAEQILSWQKYWHDQLKAEPDHILKPKQALFDQARSDLATARGKVEALVTSSKEQAEAADAAAARAVAAQQQAWNIADADEVPRGRGLMYAQQSVQVARASGAAAQAAAKATETTLQAATATVEDSAALLALAQTQAHALDTQFERVAAQEAARQAKVAADSADALAASAARHATTAKNAAATAADAEATARVAAATAQAERAEAELARDVAKSEQAIAESERQKAADAEQQAQTQRQAASDAASTASGAAATAADKRRVAEEAEGKARTARDKALAAEKAHQAKESRAAAYEAAAQAAIGTDAAESARAAADEAWAAADTAGAAAVAARAAADEATTAAENARAAATRADAAASRAEASSQNAWAAWWTSYAAAVTAHAAAAEAIDAAQAASADADRAETEAETASAASAQAQIHARAARASADATVVSAAETAGRALAAGNAAASARDASAAVVRPANEAVALGTPYQETDSAAAFAVLTGQTSQSIAAQQAAAAEARASHADAAAAKAQALADGATADAELATQAAADAAADTSRARKAAQRARASAEEAQKYAEQARASDAATSEWTAAAGEDAFYASFAATEARSAATEADTAATEAEQDAASARSAATQAESDATQARSDAVQADKDATAAEESAERANDLAEEAAAAATRAEEEDARQVITSGGGTGISQVFTTHEIEPLGDPKPLNVCEYGVGNSGCDVTFAMHYRATVDFYLCTDPDAGADVTAATCPSAYTTYLDTQVTEDTTEITHHFSNWDLAMMVNGVVFRVLWDVLTQDFVNCAKGSVSGCLWAASNFIPGKKVADAVEAIHALNLSMNTGVDFADAYQLIKNLDLNPQAMAGIRLEADMFENAVTACSRNSFPAGTAVLMADGSHKAISEIRRGDAVLAADPETGALRAEPVASTYAHDTERLVTVALTDGTSLVSTAGHRFHVPERGWVLASDLAAGDRLTDREGEASTVASVRDVSGLAPRTVYDLTVEGLHTFFVSPDGSRPQDVLVHNCDDLIKWESEGAHTRQAHVEITEEGAYTKAIAEAVKQQKTSAQTGKWVSASGRTDDALQLAQDSVRDALQIYLANQKQRTALSKWVANPKNPERATKSITVALPNAGSLGTVYKVSKKADGTWVRSSVPAGYKVRIVLMKLPGKPKGGFFVYTAYPMA
ncbi:polymorphic toxin-type HINT domain-containing protein [Streptomyces sp. NPDC048306]|uniref:polymorphic toxin-type HINT domain-containing protein n=1 Tax=Streptomyces sp. NPDC048306 TaxID=3154502 RepID=UPI0033EBCDB9